MYYTIFIQEVIIYNQLKQNIYYTLEFVSVSLVVF